MAIANQEHPNIIYIFMDDLGFGDVGCYGAVKVKTPNMDRLAANGITFTDAHASSAVCTPSRYSVLTGRYCWRTELKEGVLRGFSPPLIESGRLTVASMLKQCGYRTACIGKWHLGMGWVKREDGSIDYNEKLTESPLNNGFDYYFGISASLNMEPYCFIENDHTVGIPSLPKMPVHRGQNPQGLMVEHWRDEKVNSEITKKAVTYVDRHADDSPDQPFFLYLPLTGPHNPWVPDEPFRGSSEVGLRGDMIQEMDWTVGQIMDVLERRGLTENTIVVVTSDNGPHSFDTDERALYGHDQTAGLRGQKADIWDGGHRVPLIVGWPRRIQPGRVSNELVELTDFMATCAELMQLELPVHAAEDSFSMLPLMLGLGKQHDQPVRDAIISHSIRGMFSIRQGRWKYIEGRHSGGFHWKEELQREPGGPEGQLYDMENDPEEKENVYESRCDMVEHLQQMLDQARDSGRTRPLIINKE